MTNAVFGAMLSVAIVLGYERYLFWIN